jgi:hypothetical protein
MKNMRHVVKVMRPPPPQGESGQLNTPEATVLMEEVPCSIDQLQGKEAERMQQMYATATQKVGMYGNPNKQIKRVDYLIDQTGAQLNVLSINDGSRSQQGYIELICGEEPA